MAYLYGASIQGIQSFIFQTNRLKEIVGASELIEQICTTELTKFCKNNLGIVLSNDDFIIRAAGNIKYLFTSDKDCEKVVKFFPKHIANTNSEFSCRIFQVREASYRNHSTYF